MKMGPCISAAAALLVLNAPSKDQDPTSIRDVLDARVGDACTVDPSQGTWTLSFPAAPDMVAAVERLAEIRKQLNNNAERILALEDRQAQLESQLAELDTRLPAGDTAVRNIRARIQRVGLALTRARLEEADREQAAAMIREWQNKKGPRWILIAVGADFVQLRDPAGTERYLPLGRLEVVIRN